MEDNKDFNFKPLLYLTLYPKLRSVSIENGYTLALHGSVKRDLDLVAIAWTENAITPQELISKFLEVVKDARIDEDHITYEGEKPFGRLGFIITLGRGAIIDLSIIRPNNVDQELQIKSNTAINLLEQIFKNPNDEKCKTDINDFLERNSFKIKSHG